MLDYENQMFLEILQEDGLVIAAKGLGLENVFINIIKVYCDPGQLVLVLGTDEHEESYFIDQLKKQNVEHLPTVITAHCQAEERESIYLSGGVLFVTGRILVVDLLKNRVPVNLVSGILVYRAHSILNSHQEAFALRLFRRSNKIGFIKAFTNSALAFTVGFSQVEKVMKCLFVKKLYLWPRFHKTVASNLSKHQPEVFELHVKLTPKMLDIQTGLIDVMNCQIQELKKINKYLDLDELTLENAVAKKFHKQLQFQLDPIWDQLSFKSKQLIADLKIQRSLLMSLTHEHAVSFYAKLNSLRTTEYVMNSSGWTVLDVVDEMFKSAKSRIYTQKNEFNPEANPKWSALSEILMEIQQNRIKENRNDSEKILILTQDSRTCNQLKNYLTIGAKEYLLYETMKLLKPDKIKNIEKNQKLKQVGGQNEEPESNQDPANDDDQECYVLTLTQNTETDNNAKNGDSSKKLQEQKINVSQYFEDCSELGNLDLTSITTSEPILIIQSLKKGGDPMSLQKTLFDSLPTYVIMYVADISVIRQLEVYQNKNPSLNLKVFFLIYHGSVEEQAYLTSLRREKEAFDKLINTKTTMVITAEQDGKSDDYKPAPDDTNVPSNTRKGNLDDQAKTCSKVIVDMREFRSELPSLLHQRDIDIEPVTLLIGDYILSPDICVERKSISDLISSLNSGRLYNQAVAMTRYYTQPMLLIEFDQNKPFGLQGNYYVSKDMKSIDVTNKLQLLTMHFPRLKLVWSPSPHATAQLFEELKQGRPQPDAAKAAQIGTDIDVEDNSTMTEKYNCHIQDLVSKLPGVHSKNLRLILNKGESLDYLCSLTKEELVKMLGHTADAESLYKALHDKHKKAIEPSTSSSGKSFSKVKSRGLFFKANKNA